MAITADQVDIRYSVDYQKYLADTVKVEAAFSKSLNNMTKDAVRFGHATPIAFDPISQSFQQITRGAGGVRNSLDQLGKTMNTNKLQVGNLAAQFNDIGVTLAGGMSPLLIALQQGTQINQVLGQLEGGTLPALKQAFMSIITPINLATLGIIALGGYGVQALASMVGEGKSLEEVLKAHREQIDEITTGYTRAQEASKNYREQAARLSPELAQEKARTAQEDLTKQYDESLSKLKDYVTFVQAHIQSSNDMSAASRAQAEALAAMSAELDKTNPSFDSLLTTVERIARGGSADAFLLILSDAIGKASQSARDLASEIGATEEAIAHLSSLEYIFENIGNAVNGVKSGESRKEVQELTDKFEDGKISLSDLIAKLGDLSAARPDLQPAVEEIARLGLAADITRQKIEALSGPLGGEKVAGGKQGRAYAVTLPDTVGSVPTRRVDPYFDDPIKRTRGGGRGRSGPKENEYQRAEKALKDRIELLKAETAAQSTLNPLVNDYGFALERAKSAQQLLAAAKKAGLDVGKELSDVQKLLAGDFSGLSAKAREQAESILAMAEGAANATAESQRLAESQRELKTAVEDFSNFGQSVLSTFIKDLRDGKSATDALASALGKISDKLIDIAFKGLFDGFGGSGGAKGGLLGGLIIPGILHSGGVAGVDGYGHGKAYSASTWAGAQRFHNGGMPGLSPGEVPAILRRGEVVIPEGGMRGAGGVSVSVPISIDASGADPEAIRRLNESVDKMKAEIPAQVVASVRRATKSNIKLGG